MSVGVESNNGNNKTKTKKKLGKQNLYYEKYRNKYTVCRLGRVHRKTEEFFFFGEPQPAQRTFVSFDSLRITQTISIDVNSSELQK